LHIKEKLKGIDFLLKKICANRNSILPAKVRAGSIEMKREIKHSFNIPPGPNNNKFTIVVKDKVSFHPGIGPFDVEIEIVGFVFLREELKTTTLKAILKDNENKNFLINQCLPHSSSAVAYLTDKMGFNPLILAPKSPILGGKA